jgi:CHRD domain
MRSRRFLAIVGTLAVLAIIGAFGFAGIASAGPSRDTHEIAMMSGKQETPAADPDGTGLARVFVNPSEGTVCFSLRWDNTATPTLGHIHKAPVGVPGPIVVPLLDKFSPDQLEANNFIKGCVTSSDKALLADIAAHPDQYYVNLHNPRFPAGAIRGQLHLG